MIGVVADDLPKYIVDGRHRLEAFLQSNVPVGYADVQTIHVKTQLDLARVWRDIGLTRSCAGAR